MQPEPVQPIIPTIPPIPEPFEEGWAMIWRMLHQLHMQVELTQLELAFYKSQSSRSKWAGEYAEEAVARVYGLESRLVFYGTRTLGRVAEKDARVNEARFLLYSILHHVLGVSVADLRQFYDHNTYNYINRWKPLFDLIHRPRPIKEGKRQADYDRYAPLYQAAYSAMREAMQADGVWLDAFTDPASNP